MPVATRRREEPQVDVPFEKLANFLPRQAEAVAVSDKRQFTMFGGFRGPGKSRWLRWALLRQLMIAASMGIKGARAGLFCESYEVLRDRQIGPIETEFPRKMGRYPFGEVKQTAAHGLGFHISEGYGSGVLALRNLDDPNKYIGAEFCAVGIDQIEKSPIGVFDALRGNLRWPGIDKPRFMATGNPGIGIGLPWVKALWIDREPEKRLRPLLPEVALVVGRPGDNPYLSDAYWEMLKTQPEHIRRAWLEGDWTVIEGAAFPEWQARKNGCALWNKGPWHVIPTGPIPPWSSPYLGVDWGFAAPWACYLIAVAHDGRMTICRELYGTGVKTSDQGEAMVKLLAENGIDRARVLAYVGHDAFSKRLTSKGEYEEPIVQTWLEQGLQCVSSGRDPVYRASKLREYLRDWGPDEGWPKGRPGFQVMDCCPNLIRTLPMLQFDKTRPEQVNTEMEDHGYDAIGHVLTAMPGRGEKPSKLVGLPPRARAMEEALEAMRKKLEGDESDMVHKMDDARGYGGVR